MNTNGLVLDALGDWTRRQVFEALKRGPRAVGDLAADLPVSRPAVSQHLRVLKDAGLVTDRKDGTRRVYRIDPGGLANIRAYFDGFSS
ncbi:MAG: winged helix-turn-helix transcriptional regulator [Actinobacteria bacterium]|nr:winged helix-turn-helix transcriptional regulator [Actinomycetota bacterium]